MTSNLQETFQLPANWFWPTTGEAQNFHYELQKELPRGHILYGVPVVTFATRRGIDDVLFRHQHEPNRFTVVHLSWLGRTEVNAQHPSVEFDGSFSEFLAEEERINVFLLARAKQHDA
jgi:hypothetical protein